MKMRWTKRLGWTAMIAVALGATLLEGSASAYYGTRLGSRAESFGNSLFAATYSWNSQVVWTGSGGFPNGWGWDSAAYQAFKVSAQVFGSNNWIIDQSVSAQSTSMADSTSQTVHQKNAWIVSKVMGIQQVGPICPGGDASTAVACLTWSSSVSLFNASATYAIGFVPVTVRAQVLGNLHGGGTASARNQAYLGLNHSNVAFDSTTQDVGSYVAVNLSASAGIVVASAGVTGSFRLIDISITPSNSLKHLATPGFYSRSTTAVLPFNITTMGGSVDLWADTFLGRVGTLNLITWNGYSLVNQTVINDATSFTDPNAT